MNHFSPDIPLEESHRKLIQKLDKLLRNASEKPRELMLDLLSVSVVRVVDNALKRRKSVSVSDDTLQHITDWIKASVINQGVWIGLTDDKGRPKKLMKFGTIEQITKEADKAMRVAAQKRNTADLIDGDEAIIFELPDGFSIVSLLTPAALDREGGLMQHCVGDGSYDEDATGGWTTILSLRDRFNKPHITLEVNDGQIYQMQGKQNLAPKRAYLERLQPFIKSEGLKANIPVDKLGYVIDIDGHVYSPGNLPKGLIVPTDLDLKGVAIEALPDNLTVLREMDISDTDIWVLPKKLSVLGSLYISRTEISEIPDDASIGHLFVGDNPNFRDHDTGLGSLKFGSSF